MTALQEKRAALLSSLRRLGRAAVAFSAGVDSTFLLAMAKEALGENVLAVTGRLVSFPEREGGEAEEFCRERGIEHVVVEIDQLAIEGFAENPPERCYLCKRALFTQFLAAARERGFPIVAEGTNADDTNDYRPGLRAIAELGVRSPLREAGLAKEEIRALSREMGLPTWDKPSLACLATRFPYGETITAEKIASVDEAEQLLRARGFSQVRVRAHGNLARIEVGREQVPRLAGAEMAEEISRLLHARGFLYVAADLDGYCTGSMNKTIGK